MSAPPRSLRGQLLAWLLIPLGVLTAVDIGNDYLDANRTAGIVFDRLLLASARTIAQEVQVDRGGGRIEVTPGTVEAFAWPAPDRVVFRVSDGDGRTLAGSGDLPTAETPGEPDAPLYRTLDFEGRPMRTVAFLQPLVRPDGGGPLRVEVGATLRGRDQLAREMWGRNARQQIVILVLAALLAWVGLTRGLTPLSRLSRAVTGRSPESLEPLGTAAVQSELRPLVAALNDYMARLGERMAAQRRFIANASHQLRTPLTLLNTQVHYALATTDSNAKDEALHALRDCIRQSNRIANQLLTLSRAEPGSGIPVRLTPVVLDDVVRMALEKSAGLAERHGIDLGFDAGADDQRAGARVPSTRDDDDAGHAIVQGDEVLLLEMIANLVDNAVRYTPAGGQVTVATRRTARGWLLSVADTGPGIPPAERERVFERFYRVPGTDGDGSGLGLSIVQEIGRACGATVALHEGRDGHGLVVEVSFVDPVPAHG